MICTVQGSSLKALGGLLVPKVQPMWLDHNQDEKVPVDNDRVDTKGIEKDWIMLNGSC